jgi:flagellar biosynthesis/type III secretory pathway M-ring protein FliF/YscJ
MWREGERKDRLRLEFNTKTLAECQIGADIASIGKLRATASPDLRMESIRVVDETGV